MSDAHEPPRSVDDGPDDLNPAVLHWVEPEHEPISVLFVFAWLVVGGEETEVRLLAEALDPARFRIEVVACFRKPGMPEQTHDQLHRAGVAVDTVPYALSMEDTVAYLADKVGRYDVVVSCQDVADIYPALERMRLPPPLIEHGGLVREALSGPKHLTSRYVGVCRTIRDAAASRMPGREHHTIEIPSMVDLEVVHPERRAAVRAALGIAPETPLIGWVGRLDAKKRVEDFIDAATIVAASRPDTRFVVIGGPDAFMPDYAKSLYARASALGLANTLMFLGDRADIPDLMVALDVFVWLSRDEGMPHVIGEAGAASLPVIATRDNGSLQQIDDGASGLFVPHEDPPAVANAMLRLIEDPSLRHRLGDALRAKVERDYAVPVVAKVWASLLEEVVAERPAAPPPSLFASFLQGGFESSTHRRAHDRARVDMIATTGHDINAATDYALLREQGIGTVRDAVRWHLIEIVPGQYDWSSLDSQLAAAERGNMQVIWDLMHYGWPDDIDVWTPALVDRFARFATAAANYIAQRTPGAPMFAPVNEISFLAWAGGDAGYLNPFCHHRAHELKVQLTRAAIVAMDAIRAVLPSACFVHVDPIINVVADVTRPEDRFHAEGHRQAQFQAWDMIEGRAWPQLGGRPDLLDIVGVNYYHNNQWIHGGPPIDMDHQQYKPLRFLLFETYERYGRPIMIAETGIEGRARPKWLAYVCAEMRAARKMGVPVEGICLYPVLDHPGWDDGRYCPNGLLKFGGKTDARSIYQPLQQELKRQMTL